jgi:DNA polymerase-1
MKRTLLIDADILAYQTASANQKKYDWGDDVISVSADLEGAKEAAREILDDLMADLEADDLVICLSDELNNFRKGIYPAYKSHRKGTERPVHLYDMKDWLAAEYPTQLWQNLEADDVMGILSTEPHDGERVIVSEDKDMQTIPGLLFNPRKDTEVRTITLEQANRFHLWQTVCGDATDGYPGCPGAGPQMAEAVLDGLMWVEQPKLFKSGPRKGTEIMEWVKTIDEDTSDWERIVACYNKFGLTEKDALVQANLARILRHGDLDGNRVIPWVPEAS